jgi:hypothetical protein
MEFPYVRTSSKSRKLLKPRFGQKYEILKLGIVELKFRNIFIIGDQNIG